MTRSSADAEGPCDAPQITKNRYFPKFNQVTLSRPRPPGDTFLLTNANTSHGQPLHRIWNWRP